MNRCPLGSGVVEPLACHPFECLPAGFQGNLLFKLLGDRRVAHVFEHGDSLVALQAGFGKGHLGPGAERHALLLAIEAVAPAPQFSSRRRYELSLIHI